jgi:hypothetical protein
LRLNQETIPDFVLLFLPPCGPYLISFGHQVHRAEPTCLSTPRRPHKRRPFAPALHLHQCKSSRNLHLQYSTKSQSTPRCQSLITPRSDHPPVVGRSGPQVGSTVGSRGNPSCCRGARASPVTGSTRPPSMPAISRAGAPGIPWSSAPALIFDGQSL